MPSTRRWGDRDRSASLHRVRHDRRHPRTRPAPLAAVRGAGRRVGRVTGCVPRAVRAVRRFGARLRHVAELGGSRRRPTRRRDVAAHGAAHPGPREASRPDRLPDQRLRRARASQRRPRRRDARSGHRAGAGPRASRPSSCGRRNAPVRSIDAAASPVPRSRSSWTSNRTRLSSVSPSAGRRGTRGTSARSRRAPSPDPSRPRCRPRRTAWRDHREAPRNAARSPTPRLRRRPPSRRGRRTVLGRTARARRSCPGRRRGVYPATAGVGCSSATSSSAEAAGSFSTPRKRVDRCQMFGVSRRTGSGSHVSSTQNGRSVSATASTTIACSSRSLADETSASAFALSSSGSPDRGADPASGFERTSSPRRDTRSSGDAPTSIPSSVGAAKVYASGSTARRRCASNLGSSSRSAVTSIVLARTTLRISP